MRRIVLALALLACVGAPAIAHEGHDHRIMGTVSVIHENGFEVKAARDGKVSMVVVNEKTKILREKTTATRSEIKVGDRVVVTAMTEKDAAGKETLVAREVRLANRPKR